jgi:hypothetical protein
MRGALLVFARISSMVKLTAAARRHASIRWARSTSWVALRSGTVRMFLRYM